MKLNNDLVDVGEFNIGKSRKLRKLNILYIDWLHKTFIISYTKRSVNTKSSALCITYSSRLYEENISR